MGDYIWPISTDRLMQLRQAALTIAATRVGASLSDAALLKKAARYMAWLAEGSFVPVDQNDEPLGDWRARPADWQRRVDAVIAKHKGKPE